MADRKATGMTARQRGKRFELRCAKLLSPMAEFEQFGLHGASFQRTQRGAPQHHGDLIACDSDGVVLPNLMGQTYIECKTRARLSAGMIRRWCEEVLEKGADAKFRLLMFSQFGGPIFSLLVEPESLEDTEEDFAPDSARVLLHEFKKPKGAE